jgi:hypothetical protein
MKSDGVKLILWTQAFPVSEEFEETNGAIRIREMLQSCK